MLGKFQDKMKKETKNASTFYASSLPSNGWGYKWVTSNNNKKEERHPFGSGS